MRPGQRGSAPPPGKGSTWRRVRAPDREVAHTLRQRHRLHVHGWCIGAFTMALMWATSHLQMVMGVGSLALRYGITLGVGYIAYLLVLRAWAAWLVRPPRRRDEGGDNGWADGIDLVPDIDLPSGGARAPWPRSGGGGDFGGGGASGDFGDGLGSAGDGLGDIAGGALEAASGADEGAVVIVPVVAIFLIGAAVVLGAGALALLYFGFDVLLAVAVELAFSYATARAAMGVERAGWLSAAVRLTWKPLLGALLCAVVLGAAIDRFLPQAHSLPEAVRQLRAR
ncbi:hypothetical protein [Acidovorax sp. NCPPB 3576]|uniref:hypothetical protein n=1 Tax=Acidovorax sp. NCPPB 3576 TaxID=2940488 RepID=UPI00234A17A7|nr:hypothetical protein [Acidovorax sp. NCPPB 3576]WCM88126.1 hypothetical protein M5C98_22765 [Acidovorax sp. NCPPB 3576]